MEMGEAPSAAGGGAAANSTPDSAAAGVAGERGSNPGGGGGGAINLSASSGSRHVTKKSTNVIRFLSQKCRSIVHRPSSAPNDSAAANSSNNNNNNAMEVDGQEDSVSQLLSNVISSLRTERSN